MSQRPVHLVAPPFEAPWTGGTLYNARLVEALGRIDVSCERLDMTTVLAGTASVAAPDLWVDSLYLADVPATARAHPDRPVRLLLHYLPSLVSEDGKRAPLTSVERAALSSASSFAVTSAWLADVLSRHGVDRARVGIVPPGVSTTDAAAPGRNGQRGPGAPLRAVMVANLLPGKGVLPFLEAIVGLGRISDVVLTIVGADTFDPPYAAGCRDVAHALGSTVRFAGALSPEALLVEMAASDVLVSASRMESYGMALAEARALGLPILARRGGNAFAHVEEPAGGSLFDDDSALATALVRLARAPSELTERRSLAAGRVLRRSWDDAARDFASVVLAHASFRAPVSV